MRTAAKVKQAIRLPVVPKGKRGRIIPIVLVGTLLLPVLTACQPTETPRQLPAVTQAPAGVLESVRQYSPVLTRIRQSLEGQLPDIGWDASGTASLNRQQDGACILMLPAFRSDGDLVRVSNRFRKVMDALNPVLEPNGFSVIAVLDEGSAGWWSVTSGNAQGAKVRVSGRTSADLSLTVPVESESCSPNELAVLEG